MKKSKLDGDDSDDSFPYFLTPTFECGAGSPVGSSEDWSEDNLDAHVAPRLQSNPEVQPNSELRRRCNAVSNDAHHGGDITPDTNNNICNRQPARNRLEGGINAFNSQMPSIIDTGTIPKEYSSDMPKECEGQDALLNVENPEQMQLYPSFWWCLDSVYDVIFSVVGCCFGEETARKPPWSQ